MSNNPFHTIMRFINLPPYAINFIYNGNCDELVSIMIDPMSYFTHKIQKTFNAGLHSS